RKLPGKMIAIFSRKTRIFPIKKYFCELERSPMRAVLEEYAWPRRHFSSRLEKSGKMTPPKIGVRAKWSVLPARRLTQFATVETCPNFARKSHGAKFRIFRKSRQISPRSHGD